MPSSMLARSSEKPIRGAPIVEREYVPDIGSAQHPRCRPCTRSLPLALISSRLPAEAWRKIALECSPLGQARDGGRTVRGKGAISWQENRRAYGMSLHPVLINRCRRLGVALLQLPPS